MNLLLLNLRPLCTSQYTRAQIRQLEARFAKPIPRLLPDEESY